MLLGDICIRKAFYLREIQNAGWNAKREMASWQT
jgi:hypothetical protein